jgi:hypothetical protein
MNRPREKESDVQRAVLEYLKLRGILNYRNNSGAMSGEYKGKHWFMRFGAVGSPDIVGLIRGQYVGIEVKGTAGKQSEHQKEFQVRLEGAGGRHILGRSVEDVMELAA